MFGSKKKENSSSNQSNGSTNNTNTPQGLTCVISSGTKIEGKFTATEDVRLDGTIIGEMSCHKKLVMGSTGRAEGNVKTIDSSIHGKINGEIIASGTLHLHETCNIDGTIIARKLIVDSGASYSGDCKVGDQHFKKKG